MTYGTESYSNRIEGFSPDEIRDAAWSIVGAELFGNVLDAGSGGGGWAQRLKKAARIESITCVDLVDGGAKNIEGVSFRLCDLSREPLPVAPHSMDWVFALEVLEHLTNPRFFFQEVARVLKPSGHFFISTPNNDSLRAKLSLCLRGYFPAFCEHDYKVTGHITPILAYDLRHMAKEVGFGECQSYYPLPGLIPKTTWHWQRVFPFLRGPLWSDTFFAHCSKLKSPATKV